jgi:hypothetical protein
MIKRGFWDPPHTEARSTDPDTSHQAAKLPFRRNSQRHELLASYLLASWHGQGLTDEEAAISAGIDKGCPWKRCSELRDMGFIVPTGETRVSTGGANQRVCVITTQGREAMNRLSEEN